MDVVLQNHGAKLVYSIPEGLKELCTDISREVLHSQPENIYTFIAEYLDALLITRENAKVAVGIFHDLTEESAIYEAMWKHKGLTVEEVTRAAIVIQSAFRGFMVRRSKKGLKTRLERILKNLRIDYETAIKAAIPIQALIRGYYGRKKARSIKRTLLILAELGITERTAESNIIKIQAAWRGYIVRQQIKHAGEPSLRRRFVPKEEKDIVELSAGPSVLSAEEIKEIVLSIVHKATGFESTEAEEIAEDILNNLLSQMHSKRHSDTDLRSDSASKLLIGQKDIQPMEAAEPEEGFESDQEYKPEVSESEQGLEYDENNINEFIKHQLKELLQKAMKEKEMNKQDRQEQLMEELPEFKVPTEPVSAIEVQE